jgi:glycosyltransferase involved in cell wall biosynthesis
VLPDQPQASVVVPTRNRPGSLARCLAALDAQACPVEHEVVVVDDGSADAAAVARVVSGSARGRLIRLEGEGPAAARNRGVDAARGALVLFTDDDCEPAPDWIARLTARLRSGARATAGRTVNGERENPLAEASQTIANFLMASSLPPASGPPFAPSNNLACTAELLATTPFDERFPAAGGEDRDWCARLAATGVPLVAEPAAVVVHRHHLDLSAFWRQHVAYGRGAYRFRSAGLAGGWSEPPRFYARLLRKGFRRGLSVGGLVLLAQVATVCGFVQEAAAERARS